MNIFSSYLNNYFVETGSNSGVGIGEALEVGFKNIISIELADVYYNICKEKFKQQSNVKLYLGDSAVLLSEIIKNINDPITFWLDGHYSGGNTKDNNKIEPPLLAELRAIKEHPIKQHTVLIDDYRNFNHLGLERILFEINPAYKICLREGKNRIPYDVLIAKL